MYERDREGPVAPCSMGVRGRRYFATLFVWLRKLSGTLGEKHRFGVLRKISGTGRGIRNGGKGKVYPCTGRRPIGGVEV